MQRGRVRSTVDGCDATEDVLLIGLGILDKDVEVAILPKCFAERIDQFILGLISDCGYG